MAAKASISPSVKRPRVFLLYPYYWPLYKAGGPVQSLYNIGATFGGLCDLFVISLDRDIDSTYPEPRVKTFEWTKGANGECIYYVSSISPFIILDVIRKIQPDTILINGMFNVRTTIPGLLWGKLFRKRLIISPRGMLQEWGLKRSQLLKKTFLVGLKILLNNDEHWHATDENEVRDIRRIFGNKQQIHVASNIPRKVSTYTEIPFPEESGKIKLVFLSLINSNKNLHLIIDAILRTSLHFSLDIYGPVIDEKYWQLCKAKISDSKSIQYKGPVPPWQVPSLLAAYHFFILPTQGENFGHAIFDALASGVPVVISRRTPWQCIEEKRAGFYVDLQNDNSTSDILKKISALDSAQYVALREGSIAYAREYWRQNDYQSEYSFLFDGK